MPVFVLYDDQNRRMETFFGPHRLARWNDLPAGWTIEEFAVGGIASRGMTTLESVKDYAASLKGAEAIE